MTTIVTPVTKTEKLRFERRAKKFGYALKDFSRLAMAQFAPEPSEEAVFTDEALASIKRAELDFKQGRSRTIKTLAELV